MFSKPSSCCVWTHLCPIPGLEKPRLLSWRHSRSLPQVWRDLEAVCSCGTAVAAAPPSHRRVCEPCRRSEIDLQCRFRSECLKRKPQSTAVQHRYCRIHAAIHGRCLLACAAQALTTSIHSPFGPRVKRCKYWRSCRCAQPIGLGGGVFLSASSTVPPPFSQDSC